MKVFCLHWFRVRKIKTGMKEDFWNEVCFDHEQFEASYSGLYIDEWVFPCLYHVKIS